MTYFIEVSGEWVEIQGLPEEGQRVKQVDIDGVESVFIYQLPEGLYVDEAGKWVKIEGLPEEGQKFKRVGAGGDELISFYSTPKPPQPKTPLIRQGHFKLRLTAQERISIRQKAMEATQEGAIVFDFMDLLNSEVGINLQQAEVQQGIGYLEQIGILDSGRANDILNSPIGPNELMA